MFECTTDNYEKLYARWLEKPGTLLDWGRYDPVKHTLLDLCGGTGAVAREARVRGGSATLFDLNPRCADPTVHTYAGRAEEIDILNKSIGGRWNFVVCRQALGYLDIFEVAHALYNVTTPGALFVCNAFVRPKWSLRPYRFNGRQYLEASGHLGNTVFHLQAMSTDFDITAFRWYSPIEIEKAFDSLWTLERKEETEKSLKFCFRRHA